jgi:hypothetical protein
MATTAVERFMRQQGFAAEEPTRLQSHFRALRFQPSILGPLMLLGIIFQSRTLFFVLAAVLAWNVLLPQWNPFERFYDWAIGRRRGLPRLLPAPAPRRLAQGMAAVFMLVTGLAFSFGRRTTAYVFEGLLVVAFTALLGGKFCLGAYVYHLLCGRTAFANATCPWSDGSPGT